MLTSSIECNEIHLHASCFFNYVFFTLKQTNATKQRRIGGECVTLPETNIFAPTNGWLEYDPFLLGPGLFSGAMSC